uniref:Uncharacterized protein n=1 Tax=Chrysotila carterae TaxID=13221 RepID=A0A7S4EVC6_CHRCT
MPSPTGWGLLNLWASWSSAEPSCIGLFDAAAPPSTDLLSRQQSLFAMHAADYPATTTVVRALHAIAMVASLRNAIQLQRALRFQSSLSACFRASWAGHRPNWICLLASLASCFNVALFLLQIIYPAMIIGVEILPSAIYAANRSLFFFVIATETIHFLDVSMSLQESIYSKEQIQEALAIEQLLYLLPAVHGCVECIPLSCSASSLCTNCKASSFQRIEILVFVLGNALCFAAGGIWIAIRSDKMQRSLKACENALKDRVVVDKKAESESAATLTAHTKEITNEQVSASMQEAVNDLRCIIEARQRIRMLQAEIRRTCIPVVLLHLTFAAAPSMWNMTGFLITLNTFTMPHALAHIATNYDCAPKQH